MAWGVERRRRWRPEKESKPASSVDSSFSGAAGAVDGRVGSGVLTRVRLELEKEKDVETAAFGSSYWESIDVNECVACCAADVDTPPLPPPPSLSSPNPLLRLAWIRCCCSNFDFSQARSSARRWLNVFTGREGEGALTAPGGCLRYCGARRSETSFPLRPLSMPSRTREGDFGEDGGCAAICLLAEGDNGT